jgi:4'-phosphopantetheinyl transferase
MQYDEQHEDARMLSQTLSAREIHIWRASLHASPQVFLFLQGLLSPDESQKASHFYFQKDRVQWTIARGILRVLLGLYEQTEPHLIRFACNDYGKPRLLAEGQAASALHFNLSHSHDLALYAFACERELGIDLEYMRSNIEYDALVNTTFSPLEQELFSALPAEQKRQAFFSGWTRKEAYVKACGLGLSCPLDSFHVSFHPEDARFLGSQAERDELARWSMYHLPLSPEYAGALVAEGEICKLVRLEWRETHLPSRAILV